MTFPVLLSLLASLSLGEASSFFHPLPHDFRSVNSSWAWLSYSNPSFAVLPLVNRSALDAPADAVSLDQQLNINNGRLNTTSFVAYDERFFDIMGPIVTIKHVQKLALQTHEAPCLVPGTDDLLFVEWGPPGGQSGVHSWQYLLNTKTNVLRNITTNPPTINLHGCVARKDKLYVVTDGGPDETGYLAEIDPKTWTRKVLLNHYFEQPFLGFNDLDMDAEGNFYLTDSKSGWGRDIIPWTPPTLPTYYFVNGTTLQPKALLTTTGNANGIAVSRDSHTIYLADTGVSEFKPSVKNPYGDRALYAYSFATTSAGKKLPVLTNKRLLNNPIEYFYDGVRVSREGWIFTGAGGGVDVVDPDSGITLGSIRVEAGGNLAVSMVFGNHEMWIVGRGGVWRVSGIKARLGGIH